MAARDCGADLREEEYASLVRVGIAFWGKSVKVGFEVVREKADCHAEQGEQNED